MGICDSTKAHKFEIVEVEKSIFATECFITFTDYFDMLKWKARDENEADAHTLYIKKLIDDIEEIMRFSQDDFIVWQYEKLTASVGIVR